MALHNLWYYPRGSYSQANTSSECRLPLTALGLMDFVLRPFNLADAGHQEAAASLWTRACGKAFTLPPRAIAYNTHPCLGAVQAGQFAFVDTKPSGFVMASLLRDDPRVSPPDFGWIDALVVVPEFRRRGIGRALLAWGEAWLRGRGCTTARLGGSLRAFLPGLPAELGSTDFFHAGGYVARNQNAEVWDLGRDLREYTSPTFVRNLNASIRPVLSQDIDALRDFYLREFPGRWRYEFEQHLRDGARLSDYMILVTPRGIEACCLMTLEDSLRPIERFYPSPLRPPWGQVGTIGVSADRRRGGYGSALLDAALCHLRERGVRGCIIDWTVLVEYYGRFGFVPHRRYLMRSKELI